MNNLSTIRERFRPVLAELSDDPASLLAMIRPAQDPKFGDYQANFAMPLGKKLGRPPREVAAEVTGRVDLSDLCEPSEVAGPGFINLRLRQEVLEQQLAAAISDERLGVPAAQEPRTYVVDYSAPNVAKPMHVGHIRSTVIGDALCRVLRFLGHRVISDNHLGDWGTQFGMIIYGFKHFRSDLDYQEEPVQELSRLYKLIRRLMDYHDAKHELPNLIHREKERLAEYEAALKQPPTGDEKRDKQAKKALRRLESQLNEARNAMIALRDKIEEFESNEELFPLAVEHPGINTHVLEETVKLHSGDAENLRLWEEFLPKCREEIDKIYERLGVKFDHEYGESFYHDRLATVVEDFERRGVARESDGATCVFFEGFDTPMIIRKRDGAFLYATTDLATIQYRMETWQPDAILYVVDHRQSEHFQKLFAAARLWGYEDVELTHVSFGTVMGKDRRPFKTRAGDTVGLEGLLDDAVAKAHEVVCELDEQKPDGPQLSAEQRRQVAWVIGHGAIKYFDLSQNRTSDYVFDFDRMVSLKGNSVTYMQYAHARVSGIFTRGEIDVERLRAEGGQIHLDHDAERALALALRRLPETLEDLCVDYRPNLLTEYLYLLAEKYSAFFENCPVLKAETDELRRSRLLLCDLTARTIRRGLNLLGIDVVERM